MVQSPSSLTSSKFCNPISTLYSSDQSFLCFPSLPATAFSPFIGKFYRSPLMEGATSAGGSGPAPFLLKTYEMVDDSSTDHIVSWSPSNNSFIVWDPPEFSRLSLPNYFKHSNFSSFIRQLNTYGFRKIDPERWEFHNDDFVKGQKHLLKNIHRRKPIHSHSSHPQVDPERAAFEEEIDRLSREKSELRANVTRSKQQQTSAKSQLDEVTQRLDGMEERQNSFLHVFQNAVERPGFVENLVKKIESMDVSAYHKKRRLPQADQLQVQLVTENNSSRDNNNNQSNSRPEVLNVFQPDFSNTLTLELSPAISDRNLLSSSTHSSSEDWGSPTTTRKLPEPPGRKDAETRTSSLPFATETVDLTEAGTSLAFPSLSLKAGAKETSGLQSLQQQNLVSCEDGDGHISCQLNLSLASSPMQANVCPYAARTAAPTDQEVGRCQEIRPNVSSGKSSDYLPGLSSEGKSGAAANDMSSSQEVPVNTQAPSAAPVRVNDHFWEQFLTERPGSMDNEEASSNYRENPNDEQEDKGLHPGMSRTATNLGKLTL